MNCGIILAVLVTCQNVSLTFGKGVAEVVKYKVAETSPPSVPISVQDKGSANTTALGEDDVRTVNLILPKHFQKAVSITITLSFGDSNEGDDTPNSEEGDKTYELKEKKPLKQRKEHDPGSEGQQTPAPEAPSKQHPNKLSGKPSSNLDGGKRKEDIEPPEESKVHKQKENPPVHKKVKGEVELEAPEVPTERVHDLSLEKPQEEIRTVTSEVYKNKDADDLVSENVKEDAGRPETPKVHKSRAQHGLISEKGKENKELDEVISEEVKGIKAQTEPEIPEVHKNLSENPNQVTRTRADGKPNEILGRREKVVVTKSPEKCSCPQNNDEGGEGQNENGQGSKIGKEGNSAGAEADALNPPGPDAGAVKDMVIQSVSIVGANLAGLGVMGAILLQKINGLQQNSKADEEGNIGSSNNRKPKNDNAEDGAPLLGGKQDEMPSLEFERRHDDEEFRDNE